MLLIIRASLVHFMANIHTTQTSTAFVLNLISNRQISFTQNKTNKRLKINMSATHLLPLTGVVQSQTSSVQGNTSVYGCKVTKNIRFGIVFRL